MRKRMFTVMVAAVLALSPQDCHGVELGTYGLEAQIHTQGMPWNAWQAAISTEPVRVRAAVRPEIPAPDVDLSRFYRYCELEGLLYQLLEKYPEVVSANIIGTSADGRNLYELVLTGRTPDPVKETGPAAAPDPEETAAASKADGSPVLNEGTNLKPEGAESSPACQKRVILFNGNIHGNETANALYLMKFACEFARNPDPWILEHTEIRIVFCANPDGYEATLFGGGALKDPGCFLALNRVTGIMKSNAHGDDLNRAMPTYNASVGWNGARLDARRAPWPGWAYYPGPYLGAAPEAKALIGWLARNTHERTRLFVDFHSGGRVIYTGKPHLSDEQIWLAQDYGALVSGVTGYRLYGPEREETGLGTDGTITDLAAELASGFAFSPELGRLAPPGSTGLVRKYGAYPCKVGVVTVETTMVSGRARITPEQQCGEWDRLRPLFDALVWKAIQ